MVPGKRGYNPVLQLWATINDWRNITVELLHKNNITYYILGTFDKSISTVDHILNNGSQCVLQPNGLLVLTDNEILQQSDHRPIWAMYMVSGGRSTQRLVNKTKEWRSLNYSAPKLHLRTKQNPLRYTKTSSRGKFQVPTLRTWVQRRSYTKYRK